MTILYEIVLTIVNLTNNDTKTFNKEFSYTIDAEDELLYNNNHLIGTNVSILSLFKDEVKQYCDDNSITNNNIDIDEFNIISHTDRVDVYFEPGDGQDQNQLSLTPNIKCYVYPKYEQIPQPILNGEVYDCNTIIWSWKDDGCAHRLVSDVPDVNDTLSTTEKVIADIPIGTNTYSEINLQPDTAYVRKLVAYDAERSSDFSPSVTLRTAIAPIDVSLDEYKINKNYDYTSKDTERQYIDERLYAFHSGIGDFNDLKVYKQMDADFYQKFKAYIQLRGQRTQKEKMYDSVGFNYKVCLESTEDVQEQKGEVTFDIDAYPRENISISDYMYATKPVTIFAQMQCDVLMRKKDSTPNTVFMPYEEPAWEKRTAIKDYTVQALPNTMNEPQDPTYQDVYETVTKSVLEYPHPTVLLIMDVTTSLNSTLGGDGVKTLLDVVHDSLKQAYYSIAKGNRKFIQNAHYYFIIFGGNKEGKVINKNSYNKKKDNLKNLLADINNDSIYSKISASNISKAETDWSGGFVTAKEVMNSSSESGREPIVLFFTDGGWNTIDCPIGTARNYNADSPHELRYVSGLKYGSRALWTVQAKYNKEDLSSKPYTKSSERKYITIIKSSTTDESLLMNGYNLSVKENALQWMETTKAKQFSSNTNEVNVYSCDVTKKNILKRKYTGDSISFGSKNAFSKLKSATNGINPIFTCTLVYKHYGYIDKQGNVGIFYPKEFFDKCAKIISNDNTMDAWGKSEKAKIYSWSARNDFGNSIGKAISEIFKKITKKKKGKETQIKTGTIQIPPGAKYYTEDGEDTDKKFTVPETGELTDLPYYDPDTNQPTDQEEITKHKEVDCGWHYLGWNPSGTIAVPANWDIDEYKWIHLVLPGAADPSAQQNTIVNNNMWMYTINDTVTPVVYSRNQRRAIIPSDSIIKDENFDDIATVRQPPVILDSRSVFQLIDEGVKSSPDYGEWLPVKASSNDKTNDYYIVSGLFFRDSYLYSDEDTNAIVNASSPSSFSDEEDGYEGTLNVYTLLNKLDTPDTGDDIYLVSKNNSGNKVYLSGYTDSIIYDGDRYESFELNAYDHEKDVLLSKQLDYSNLMWNRMNNQTQYPGPSKNIRHVLEIKLIDKDIKITENELESSNFKKLHDWGLLVPPGTDMSDPSKLIRDVTYPVIQELNFDIIAHNDEHYKSPVLNYRFALEDPNAYTPYYEILPDCDPDSTYKHIVLLHIYYARNIFIKDREKLLGTSTVYLQSFGDNNICNTSFPYWPSSTPVKGQTYFRDDYIDNYLWFEARPMREIRNYYDEKPNPGMAAFYGNVNGRYRENNKNGKQDLRVATPKFNLPTTIDANNIKIYIMITEFQPKDALVSYKWDNPSSIKDSVTNVNGDYVTFSSDSITNKNVTYNDLVQTVTTEGIEVNDNKTTLHVFKLTKPLTKYTYDKWFVNVTTDNSDVMTMNYPNEIIFDDSNNADLGVNFKGVVNATTKWSPRIHNGYYYLNQHEYYAYSEFDVDANFEQYTDDNYKTVTGYLTVDVDLIHKAGSPEHYEMVKNTKSELMQDEDKFVWVNGKGLTLKPSLDGLYYKEYVARTYTSPVIMFPHVLTSADRLDVTYNFEDSSTTLPLSVRSYNLDEGKWSDWTPFINNTVPQVPLSCAYQVSGMLAASVINNDKEIEDYMCCYLDWKDDIDSKASTNIVTITDHIQAGPDKATGTFISKVIDFGCRTKITLDIFASNINQQCELYIGFEDNNPNRLLVENINWIKVQGNITIEARMLRYKLVCPYGEKIYWLHKKFITKETHAILPYISQIRMNGDYVPVDTHDSFQEIQSFGILTDGNEHKPFDSIYDIISGDVNEKGFKPSEIQRVTLNVTNSNMSLRYSPSIDVDYPTMDALKTPVYVTANYEIKHEVKYTPYIYADFDDKNMHDVIHIKRGTPQQYSPITVEDDEEVPYNRVYKVNPDTMKMTEDFTLSTEDDKHYIKLSRNDFDIKTLEITRNGEPFTEYAINNNLVIFNDILKLDDTIQVTYNILNSFYADIDYDKDTTNLTIYSNYDREQVKKNSASATTYTTVTKTYKDCNLAQIYATGLKIYLSNHHYIKQDNDWTYEASTKSLIMNKNKDGLSIIINQMHLVKSYKLNIVARSLSSDNDIIGAVVGYVTGSNGVPHTLTYLVSLSNQNEFNLGNHTIALVLDYGMAQKILGFKDIDFSPYKLWTDMPNGITLSVSKQDNIVSCAISEWNDPTVINNDTRIEFDLNSNNDTKQFTNSVNYGFCCQSQKNTYFEASVLTGELSSEVTVEELVKDIESIENRIHKYKVYFETNKRNNKFIARNLSMNPVYRTDYKGFIYLTDDHNEPYKINIYCNPRYIKAGGYDKIDISVECLDYEDNPVISKDIHIDCLNGILNFDDDKTKHLTDINGVVHVLYESSVLPCEDTFTARTETSDGKVIENSVKIINE